MADRDRVSVIKSIYKRYRNWFDTKFDFQYIAMFYLIVLSSFILLQICPNIVSFVVEIWPEFPIFERNIVHFFFLSLCFYLEMLSCRSKIRSALIEFAQ